MNQVTAKYWTKSDLELLKLAKSIPDLRKIAFDVIYRMPLPVLQVCGPISTGGLGSIRENLMVFRRYIRAMQKDGWHVFDQMPFEPAIQRIRSGCTDRTIERSILYDFYLPLFKSGAISELVFMPSWKESIGACWEFAQGTILKMKITLLSHPVV